MTLDTSNEKYIHYKHLYLLTDDYSAILLGYHFNITKTEYLILARLIKSTSLPLPAEEIAAEISPDATEKTVSYHISKINAKAKLISNRILIKNISKKGYFLNKEM